MAQYRWPRPISSSEFPSKNQQFLALKRPITGKEYRYIIPLPENDQHRFKQ
jgi:hypothetical protein